MQPQPVNREILLEAAISPAKEIDHVTVQRITMQPNTVGGAHIHSEPLLGAIVSGSAILQIEGQSEKTLQPGDAFYEPAGITIAHFSAGSEGVVFLAYSLLGSGEEPHITMSI